MNNLTSTSIETAIDVFMNHHGAYFGELESLQVAEALRELLALRVALKLALQAMEFMGDTLNNLDAVCAEDVERVTHAFEAVRAAIAAAPKPEPELAVKK